MRASRNLRTKLSATIIFLLLGPLSAAMPLATVSAAVPAPATNHATAIDPSNLPRSNAWPSTIKTLLQAALGIIGAFAFLSMTLSGLKYITSGGDPGKTSEAKKGIVFALVGLAIAIAAEAIVTFVVNWASP